ncbi:MAG: hydroxyacylglutathione hydrolase [Proteobacteria bacterium]|nr:hydroxyacylglutathione hydrolase [Pseudomonadota bacterium]
MAELEIEIVPVLRDNYAYLVREPASGAVAAIDPGAAAPVRAALERRGWRPSHVLVTHHHHDHTAGCAEIKAAYGCPLVGPRAEAVRIAGLDEGLGDGDTFALGRAAAEVIATPGHTLGHVAFWFAGAKALFCGDTLFVMGCGRLSEGGPEAMWASLKRLRALAEEGRVYCGHEYTETNARFALRLEPGNSALRTRAAEVERLRAAGRPTVPSTIAEERRTNPFLRCDEDAFRAAVGLAGKDAVAVFAEVRRRKDAF